MRIVAFAGPSLPPDRRGAFPGVDWRPPAEAGDLLRLEPESDLTLCLIDGYFDHRPAVRHKEILLLLSEGVRMFGASSIGALRAAEMSPFGMIGIGSIYRAYAAGRLVGDDEVALIHSGAEWGWRPLSLPLVDLRATLCAALRQRAAAPAEARALLEAGTGIHYVERSWDLVLADAALAAGRREAIRSWLKSGEVARKRLDAEACLRTALSPPETKPDPPEAVSTDFLRALARVCGVSLEGRL
jgi:hypothetical protein